MTQSSIALRFHTSVYRPSNPCQMKSCMTKYVVAFPTSRNYKFLRVSLSLTSQFALRLLRLGVNDLPRHVLKTNFYQSTKVALSFRLTPDFLPEVEYPKTPFGVFFVIGNEFRGFHIRFRDVARGGIRLVMSRNRE